MEIVLKDDFYTLRFIFDCIYMSLNSMFYKYVAINKKWEYFIVK